MNVQDLTPSCAGALFGESLSVFMCHKTDNLFANRHLINISFSATGFMNMCGAFMGMYLSFYFLFYILFSIYRKRLYLLTNESGI